MNHNFPESSSIGTLSSQKLKDNGSFSLNLFYANKKGLLVKDMMKSPSYRVYPRLKKTDFEFCILPHRKNSIRTTYCFGVVGFKM